MNYLSFKLKNPAIFVLIPNKFDNPSIGSFNIWDVHLNLSSLDEVFIFLKFRNFCEIL